MAWAGDVGAGRDHPPTDRVIVCHASSSASVEMPISAALAAGADRLGPRRHLPRDLALMIAVCSRTAVHPPTGVEDGARTGATGQDVGDQAELADRHHQADVAGCVLTAGVFRQASRRCAQVTTDQSAAALYASARPGFIECLSDGRLILFQLLKGTLERRVGIGGLEYGSTT